MPGGEGGAYSKLADGGERLRTLLEMVPEGAPESIGRTPKQVQRRLDSGEVHDLIE